MGRGSNTCDQRQGRSKVVIITYAEISCVSFTAFVIKDLVTAFVTGHFCSLSVSCVSPGSIVCMPLDHAYRCTSAEIIW